MKSLMVQTLNSYLARNAMVRLNDIIEISSDAGIQCEGDVLVTKAVMAQDYDNYKLSRPYLKLIGEVQALRGEFPHNVGEVVYDNRQKPPVEFHYEMTDNELAVLCQKGLFDDDFECPAIFENNVFTLPMTCSTISIAPTEESDEPILFVGVADQYNLFTDSEHSGYDITSYFEDKKVEEHTRTKVAELSEQAVEKFHENELDVPVEAKNAQNLVPEDAVEQSEELEADDAEEKELRELFAEMTNEEPSKSEDLAKISEPAFESEKQEEEKSVPVQKPVPETVVEDDVSGFAEDKEIGD